jgi:2'-5' RNA ligase
MIIPLFEFRCLKYGTTDKTVFQQCNAGKTLLCDTIRARDRRDKMHYFIALDFDKPTREQFHAYAKTLEKHANKARIVQEDHVHLTLSFLGTLDDEQEDKAKAIVEAMDVASFDLTFSHISHFTPHKGGNIVWIGPEESKALTSLHAQLEKELVNSAFKVDERPFTPHVTLARGVRINVEQNRLFKRMFESFKTTAKSMSLLCSVFEEGKLTYKLVARNDFDKD